jgi:hypothetical protein
MTWDPRRRLLTTAEAAESVGRGQQAIWDWRRLGLLTPFAWRGRSPLYLEIDVLSAEQAARTHRARSGQTRAATGDRLDSGRDGSRSCDQGG